MKAALALYKMVSVNKEEGLLYSRSNATGDFSFTALKGGKSTVKRGSQSTRKS